MLAYLKDNQFLLVLDQGESVLDAVAMVAK
jgi:hypothetical protein